MIKLLLFFIMFYNFLFIAFSQEAGVFQKSVNIDKKEIIKISGYDPIIRDRYFKKNLNKIIIARGYVESVGEKIFLKKQYCITIIDNTPSKKIDLRYHVYTKNKDFLVLVKKGDLFEFKGQFVMYTPLNSKRNSYLIDVLLEEGAVIVE